MYNAILNIPRGGKRAILLAIDTLLIPITLYISFVLRFGINWVHANFQAVSLLFLTTSAIGCAVILYLGLSRVKLRAFENQSIMRTALGACGISVAFSIVCVLFQLTSWVVVAPIFAVYFFAFSIGIRIAVQAILSVLADLQVGRKRVLVYGAGQAGIQLVSALRQSLEVRPIAFIDDSIAMSGQIVAGLPVHPRRDLEALVERHRIDQVLLAVPSAPLTRRKELVEQLKPLNCEVLTLPSFVELINSKGILDSLRPVAPDALLGRDKVELDLPEISESYAGKSVAVTGAGGSIGSELCRQLLNCGIEKLLLYDHSEFGLYSIHKELQALVNKNDIKITPVLGSVTSETAVTSAFQKSGVQIVLHAAAYKHVPLVEENELEGLRNNVLGTKVVAEVARKLKLERFILVSTDKAVRPTNIMGATKRLAELTIQDMASRSKTTLFSMVRFGNVLGSSGSVIPLFKEQIARGGPLTVTHSDVTRYFMTIPEAARLVLIAGSFARGGDVFVLDMGKPVKIKDLARSMVELSGLTIRDDDNPNGDIEIQISGLRPGEKLYEELLIGNDMLTTPHPKILRAQETSLSEIEVANVIKEIRTAIDNSDPGLGRFVVEKWVEGYHTAQVGS